jgi:hypothetical protein
MAKSITSYKKMVSVNPNILVVEFHTIYHKDTKGKTVDYKRERTKFKDGVDKKIWKKLKVSRPFSTIIELPNNCEDWIYSEIFVRYSVKM